MRLPGKLRIVGAIAVALTTIGQTSAQDASTFDNAGVLLGQTVEEASSTLTRQGFRVERSTMSFKLAPDQPYVRAIQGDKDDDTTHETVVVRFDEPPSEARSYLVWRSIGYKPGKAPTLESYRAAVRAKAGNETYWRDDLGSTVEQYVQWSRAGGKRKGLFNVLDSLPSSYPNPCVVGIAVRSPQEALNAKVLAPDYGQIGGSGPPRNSTVFVPQAHCASGLLLQYWVPNRATRLVPDVNVMLLDQARMEAMAVKRDQWLKQLQTAKIDAARKGSGVPVL